MAVRNVAFESAVCKYKQLTTDERIRMIAENEEKAWKDRQAELDYAMNEGRYNQKIEIAKNLLDMFIPVDQIKKATGLSKEEIEKLRWIIFFNFIVKSKTWRFAISCFLNNLIPRKIFNTSINQNFVRNFW